MLTRIRKKMRENGMRVVPILALMIVLATAGRAYALSASLPIVANNGDVSCPTCIKATSPTQYAVGVGTADQTLGFIAPDASTNKWLFSGGASANPTWRVPTIADIPDAIKTGTTNETKLVTYGAGSTTAGKQLTLDTDGNLYSSIYDVGAAGSIVPAIDVSPIGPLTVLTSTPVFCGLDGQCSVTANGADVQTRYTGTGSFVGLNCAPTGGTTNAIKAELRSGTCGNALATGDIDYTLGVTAWATGTPAGTVTSFTTGQCVVIKFTAATNADKTGVRCSVRQSAGAAS